MFYFLNHSGESNYRRITQVVSQEYFKKKKRVADICKLIYQQRHSNANNDYEEKLRKAHF